MSATHSKAKASRKATDRALRAERERTDEALREQVPNLRAAQDAASGVRASVDDELRRIRERHDQRIAREPQLTVAEALARERGDEDAMIRAVRGRIDEIEQARGTQEEILLRLFEQERSATDHHLRTERALADEAIVMRFRYLAMLGHDLRSMLATVALQTAMLGRDAAGATSATVERIRHVVLRMGRLVTDLVDVASVEAGALKVLPRAADLAEAVAETAQEFEVQARNLGVSLESEARDAPLTGVFDYERILQVLANLVGNALKWTPAGGRVRIEADRTADALRLSVQDTGRGIPSDKLDVIFERFSQVDPAQHGSGLGLFIARSIIAAHRGRIWAESTLGAGSTFVFTLPAGNVPA